MEASARVDQVVCSLGRLALISLFVSILEVEVGWKEAWMRMALRVFSTVLTTLLVCGVVKKHRLLAGLSSCGKEEAVLTPGQLRRDLVVELLVCLIHLPPLVSPVPLVSLNRGTGWLWSFYAMDPRWAAVVHLRLYLVAAAIFTVLAAQRRCGVVWPWWRDPRGYLPFTLAVSTLYFVFLIQRGWSGSPWNNLALTPLMAAGVYLMGAILILRLPDRLSSVRERESDPSRSNVQNEKKIPTARVAYQLEELHKHMEELMHGLATIRSEWTQCVESVLCEMETKVDGTRVEVPQLREAVRTWTVDSEKLDELRQRLDPTTTRSLETRIDRAQALIVQCTTALGAMEKRGCLSLDASVVLPQTGRCVHLYVLTDDMEDKLILSEDQLAALGHALSPILEGESVKPRAHSGSMLPQPKVFSAQPKASTPRPRTPPPTPHTSSTPRPRTPPTPHAASTPRTPRTPRTPHTPRTKEALVPRVQREAKAAELKSMLPENFRLLEDVGGKEACYQFGSRRIRVVANVEGAPVVHVGGGYMIFSEFVERYGKAECVRIRQGTAKSATAVFSSTKGLTMVAPKGGNDTCTSESAVHES